MSAPAPYVSHAPTLHTPMSLGYILIFFNAYTSRYSWMHIHQCLLYTLHTSRQSVSHTLSRTHHAILYCLHPCLLNTSMCIAYMTCLHHVHCTHHIAWRGAGLGSSTIFKNLMSPTPRRKWYLTTGRRAHYMVLDPIPQPLPVHFFGSRPQPPTSHRIHHAVVFRVPQCLLYTLHTLHTWRQCVLHTRYLKTKCIAYATLHTSRHSRMHTWMSFAYTAHINTLRTARINTQCVLHTPHRTLDAIFYCIHQDPTLVGDRKSVV